jgi:hypothetical protein
VEPKPVPGPEIVTDDTANARFQIEIETWGERGWAAVARICRWAQRHGAPVPCPSATEKEQ